MPSTRKNGTLAEVKQEVQYTLRSHYKAKDVINWCREKYGENWDKKKKSKRKAEARFALSEGIEGISLKQTCYFSNPAAEKKRFIMGLVDALHPIV